MRHLLRALALALPLLAAATAAVVLSVATARAAPSDLFISEYVEGSSSNKALELYNGTGAPVTLTGHYSVQLYANGSPTVTATIPLTGTVAAGDVFVLARSAAVAAILAQADQTTSNFLWNGNDAVALVKDGANLDVLGQIGVDPGVEWGTGDASTADNTLRRKPAVLAGDPSGSDAFDPALEWDGFPIDTFDGLGGHTVSIGPNQPPDAIDDSVSTDEDAGPLDVAVLANDSDPNGDALAITSASDPANGTVSVAGSAVTYLPDADFNGTDSFTYTVSDGRGGTDTATVSVTVAPVNDDPDPEDDAATTTEEIPVSIDVLANDSDVDGDTLFATGVDQGASGSVTIAPDGRSVIYAPAADFNGLDAFEYTVTDAQGGTEIGEAVVTVTPVNDPPVAVPDSATVFQGTSVAVDVLANDSPGPANESLQTLTVASVGLPGHGTVTIVGSGPDAGKVRYTPAPGYIGADSFSYDVSDGELSASALVTISVKAAPAKPPCSLAPTILGTRGNDVIVGTPGDDVIRAGRGNDVIDGGGGNDVICGGPGADRITGAGGNDRIAGGSGADTIAGGAGNDRVRGGYGADSITTGPGDDVVSAGGGNDTVNAGDGRNAVAGAAGDDRLTAGAGDDRLDGGPGTDACDADGGHNTVVHCE